MSVSVVGLSIDCADAAALARFWSGVLGRPVNPGADAGHAAIDATDPASGPRLSFQKVPEPKTVKNRLHLDLRTDRFEAENDRLTSLGATAIRRSCPDLPVSRRVAGDMSALLACGDECGGLLRGGCRRPAATHGAQRGQGAGYRQAGGRGERRAEPGDHRCRRT